MYVFDRLLLKTNKISRTSLFRALLERVLCGPMVHPGFGRGRYLRLIPVRTGVFCGAEKALGLSGGGHRG